MDDVLLPLLLVGLAFVAIERLVPARQLPGVAGWCWRATLFNGLQLGMVVLGGLTWERWLRGTSLLELSTLPGWAGAAVGYVVSTFVYYWWHRARHEVNALWLLFHQLHHSPARIETITAFYKHPLELLANSLLSAAISYLLLGLTVEMAAWVTAVSAVAEFVYHVNIRTPRWLGWFIQRPEMHRIHHERGRHFSNFGDLPLWDWLFGTYKNPETYDGPCGFRPERELALAEMLTFRNVNGPLPKKSA